MRPLNCLRNFVRFGCSIIQLPFGSSRFRRRRAGVACRCRRSGSRTSTATAATARPAATIVAVIIPARTRRAALLHFRELLIGGHRIVLDDLALEDPDLDADDAVSRACNAVAEVD